MSTELEPREIEAYLRPYVRFRRMVERRGRGRLTLRSLLLQDGARAASFEGDYVALK